jgi:hypothetical protein
VHFQHQAVNRFSASELGWVNLNCAVQKVRIASAFRIFRSHGIEPILFKGWTVGRLYPAHAPRHFTDMDIAVSGEDFELSQRLVSSDECSKLNIDLHRCFRHFDQRPWATLFQCSELVELENTPVRILSAEDNLRIICGHWLNDGGANHDRLWDIYYSVEKRPTTFDWDKCLHAAGHQRRSWVIYAIAMAHEYLGLHIDDLPFSDEARAFPDWMRRTVEEEWKKGVPLRDIRTCFGDWPMLFAQIRKRLPPNPIQATIEMGKSLDDPRRRYFQVWTMLRRAASSAGKVKYHFFPRENQRI